jgi:hypothetical protein
MKNIYYIMGLLTALTLSTGSAAYADENNSDTTDNKESDPVESVAKEVKDMIDKSIKQVEKVYESVKGNRVMRDVSKAVHNSMKDGTEEIYKEDNSSK